MFTKISSNTVKHSVLDTRADSKNANRPKQVASKGGLVPVPIVVQNLCICASSDLPYFFSPEAKKEARMAWRPEWLGGPNGLEAPEGGITNPLSKSRQIDSDLDRSNQIESN